MTALDRILIAGHELSVRLGSREYVVGFDVDTAEAARRDAEGLGAVRDYAAIHALWQIPLGGHVDSYSLPHPHVELFATLPNSIVIVHGDAVERRLRVPVVCRYLVAERASATAALDALGDRWWAPIEVARIGTAASRSAVRRAERSGTGLVDATGVQALPTIKRIGRPTPLLWRQAELVYAAWLSSRAAPTAAVAPRP